VQYTFKHKETGQNTSPRGRNLWVDQIRGRREGGEETRIGKSVSNLIVGGLIGSSPLKGKKSPKKDGTRFLRTARWMEGMHRKKAGEEEIGNLYLSGGKGKETAGPYVGRYNHGKKVGRLKLPEKTAKE